MGFLTMHFSNQTGSEEYGVWAGNATAEWIASWSPGYVSTIEPDIGNPFTADNNYI